jgi:uncharacterized membrane protein (DUF4010 family)
MDTVELLGRLAVAFGIGLLFGIERGWQAREAEAGSRTAGFRTYTLIGIFGGVWGAMFPILGPIPLSAAALALAGAFALFTWSEMTAKGAYSVTGVVAALLAFSLGAMAIVGNTEAAAAVTAACVAVLAARRPMHAFLKKITWLEFRSGVLLLAMSAIALPVLPNRTVDPWNAINPYELWLMTILIAVVSFLGYVAVRLLGANRGVLVSSAAGALISSTTVTINNAQLARKGQGKNDGIFASATCIAWIVSYVRMTALAVVTNFNMLAPLGLTMLAATSVLIGAAWLFARGDGQNQSDAGSIFRNPLDLSFVLKFGALLGAVTVGVNIAQAEFGSSGVIGLAGITGFLDVDPVTLSVSRAAQNEQMYRDAAKAILLAAAANMTTKMGASVVLGGLKYGLALVAAGILSLLAAGAVFLVYGV